MVKLFRRSVVLAVVVIPGTALAQTTPAPPAALTLQQAIETARETNPDFLATANDLRVAKAATLATRGNLLPSADVSSSFGYTAAGEARFGSITLSDRNPASYSSSYDVGLTYQLSGSKLLQPRAARAQERATRGRIAGSEANLVGQVAQQYLSALQARELATQAEQEVKRAREHQRLAESKRAAGTGMMVDVRKAEVQTGQAEVRLLQQNAAFASEMLRLGQLMGAPLLPGTRLVSEFSLFEPMWQPDSLVHLAILNNPGLLATRASADAAQTQVRAARYNYLPTMSFRLGMSGYAQRYGDENALVAGRIAGAQGAFAACQRENLVNASVGLPAGNCGSDPAIVATQDAIRQGVLDANGNYPFRYSRQPVNASLSFSLPIFDGFSRRRQVEEARVTAQDARLQVRSQELQLATDIATATLNLQTAYRSAQLQAQVQRSAEEELHLAQERFRYGVATSLEVTDAQTSLSQAEQGRIDAIYVFQKSFAALEAFVGQPLR